ncbi:hypothetical protein NSA19_02380 [Actinomyces bowdenii]|uniref:hypothetical protein n=1 Tax=Actinomyces bowdenii TaxID=131109 RepID=UPI00214B8F2D|nr:hypothetical protein [Actinomyces bowdenii]MCR2051717.1 hypothetical protein [Actinomyces bowdenii]
MSGTIRLPYKRFMAGGPARPTGVFLGGGPGVSNLDFTPPREWLELMDVVVLEYRGVGRSSPVLDSPFFARAMCEPITSLSLSGASRLSPLIARGFADLRAQGVAFEDFGLGAMADDIEAMRLDLGWGPCSSSRTASAPASPRRCRPATAMACGPPCCWATTPLMRG